MGSSAKPVILLVHGAWHTPSCWSLLIPHLVFAGYKTQTVTLPSVAAAETQEDFSADVSTIASAITTFADDGQDVALLLHSYGGIPGSSAVRGLTKTDREGQGKQGGVSHLIYVAAFMLDEGISLVDAVGGSEPDWQEPDWWLFTDDTKKTMLPGGPAERFYNDTTDQSVLDDLVKGLKPHATRTFFSKNTYAAWKDLPTMYIGCTNDNAIPFEGQKAMLAGADAALQEGGSGRQVNTVIMESDHSPFISRPERLAQEVAKALET